MREGAECSGLTEGLFGPDRLTEPLREKGREMILTLAEAESAEALAVGSYERSIERHEYRMGKAGRRISTGLGATVIELPRPRITVEGAGEGVAVG